MTETLDAGRTSRHALRRAGDRVVLIEVDGATATGRRLESRVESLAGALAARSLTGQRIGAWYRNGIAAFEAFLAIEWLGATRVAVDPELPPAEAQEIFDAANVRLVIADEEHANFLGGDVLVHDQRTTHREPPWTEQVAVDSSFPYLLYPRSVVNGELFKVTRSYGNWASIMRVNCELYSSSWYGPALGSRECGLTMQQLMHGTGQVLSFPLLLMGYPQVILPKFTAESALEAIDRHDVTTTFGVPGMLSRIATAVQSDASPLPLKRALYGGAPLSTDELCRLHHAIGPSLVQLYGRAEAGWPLAVLGHGDHAAVVSGDQDLATSCGKVIPHVEARVVDVAGTPDGFGELQTRNPMVSAEYADADGWCSLGDVARLDHRGYLHLAGRLDDMINTGSYHVYPGQVAAAIESIPGVVSARVTGESDPTWGQAVTADIVSDGTLEWDELVTLLRAELPQKIARFKVPKRFRRVAPPR